MSKFRFIFPYISRTLFRTFTFITLITTSTYCLSESVLTVEREAERLILAAQNALKNQQVNAADQYLIRAEALKTPLANHYHFYRGKVSYSKNDFQTAQQHLIQYTQNIQSEDPHYEETLTLLTAIEKKSVQAKASALSEKPQIEWHRTQNAQPYIENLKSLYLTEQGKLALEMHINDLLTSYPTADKTAANKNQKSRNQNIHHYKTSSDTRNYNARNYNARNYNTRNYNIQTTEQGSIKTHLTINKPGSSPNKEVKLNTSEISVYGLNHQIEFKCENFTQRCWIKNPINQSVWLELDNNESAAKELATAMGYLVQVMQQQ